VIEKPFGCEAIVRFLENKTGNSFSSPAEIAQYLLSKGETRLTADQFNFSPTVSLSPPSLNSNPEPSQSGMASSNLFATNNGVKQEFPPPYPDQNSAAILNTIRQPGADFRKLFLCY
jgi:hypothetical protein